MRAYAWTHFQMSPGQRGLQAAHAICRIRSTNKFHPNLQEIWDTWEEQHSTMVYLNGGFSGDLINTFQFLLAKAPNLDGSFKHKVPFTAFNEDEYTLNGAMTAVAAIVHPRYYTPVALARQNREFKFEDLLDKELDGTAYSNALLEINSKEPNPNDRVDVVDFQHYNAKEVEFIKFLSGFGLANLG